MAQKSSITAGSFSRLDTFETCALRAKLSIIDKIPEPDRGPPPKGLTEWHNDRGHRIHKYAEGYVQGLEGHDIQLPEMTKYFAAEFTRLRELYAAGKVTTEEMWCFDNDWCPVATDDWNNTKFRIQVDATVWRTKSSVTIIDYKSGKRWGNELKHGQQVNLYGLGTVLRYDQVKNIDLELWYLDKDELIRVSMTRESALRYFDGWDKRNQLMMMTTDFQPSPSKENCKWCPYSPRVSGHCPVGK